MYQVQDHVGLPPDRVEDTNPQNTRAYEPLDSASEVACRLRQFYAPHNRRLARLFGGDERFLWGASPEGPGELDVPAAGAGCRFVTAAEAPEAGQDLSEMVAEFEQQQKEAAAQA